MADTDKEEPVRGSLGKLLTLGKVFGALAAIGGVVLALSGWIFSSVMAERDRKIEDLQSDLVALSHNISELTSQLRESEEHFTDLRIAMELLNARLELRTGGTPTTVRVRTRPSGRPAGGAGGSATVPVVHEDPPFGAEPPPDFTSLRPSLGPGRFPAPPTEARVIRTDGEASAAFDQALGDLGHL